MDRRTSKTALKDRVDYTVTALGMREFLDTRLSALSGGERKKVALAVQLLNDPPILFCDEVTTGLDSYSATHIVNTLKRILRSTNTVSWCCLGKDWTYLWKISHRIFLFRQKSLANKYCTTVSKEAGLGIKRETKSKLINNVSNL